MSDVQYYRHDKREQKHSLLQIISLSFLPLVIQPLVASFLFSKGQMPLGGDTPLTGISREFLPANEPIRHPGLRGELTAEGGQGPPPQTPQDTSHRRSSKWCLQAPLATFLLIPRSEGSGKWADRESREELSCPPDTPSPTHSPMSSRLGPFR